jgi:hypothetical protein
MKPVPNYVYIPSMNQYRKAYRPDLNINDLPEDAASYTMHLMADDYWHKDNVVLLDPSVHERAELAIITNHTVDMITAEGGDERDTLGDDILVISANRDGIVLLLEAMNDRMFQRWGGETRCETAGPEIHPPRVSINIHNSVISDPVFDGMIQLLITTSDDMDVARDELMLVRCVERYRETFDVPPNSHTGRLGFYSFIRVDSSENLWPPVVTPGTVVGPYPTPPTQEAPVGLHDRIFPMPDTGQEMADGGVIRGSRPAIIPALGDAANAGVIRTDLVQETLHINTDVAPEQTEEPRLGPPVENEELTAAILDYAVNAVNENNPQVRIITDDVIVDDAMVPEPVAAEVQNETPEDEGDQDEAPEDEIEAPSREGVVVYDNDRFGRFSIGFQEDLVFDVLQETIADPLGCNVYMNPNYAGYPITPYNMREDNMFSEDYQPDNELPTLTIHFNTVPSAYNSINNIPSVHRMSMSGYRLTSLYSQDGTAPFIHKYRGRYPAIFREVVMEGSPWSANGLSRFNLPVALFTDPHNLYILGNFFNLHHQEYGYEDMDDEWLSWIYDLIAQAGDCLVLNDSGEDPSEWRLEFVEDVDPHPTRDPDSLESKFLAEVYSHTLMKTRCGTVADAEQRRDELADRLDEHFKAIQVATKELGEAANRIGYVREKVKTFKPDLMRECDHLRELEGVAEIIPTMRSLIVLTEDISFYDDRNELFRRLGPMQINIKNTGTIRIRNLKWTRDAYSKEMHHPHVFKDERLCAGNIESTLPHFFQEMAFTALIDILLQSLTRVNHEDPAGQYASCWPEISDEEFGFLSENFDLKNANERHRASLMGHGMYLRHLKQQEEERANDQRKRELIFQSFNDLRQRLTSSEPSEGGQPGSASGDGDEGLGNEVPTEPESEQSPAAEADGADNGREADAPTEQPAPVRRIRPAVHHTGYFHDGGTTSTTTPW